MSSAAYTNSQAEQRVVLGNISWELFLKLAQSAASPRGKFAYDNGVLEIMSPSMMHESIKRIIGRMIADHSYQESVARQLGQDAVPDSPEHAIEIHGATRYIHPLQAWYRWVFADLESRLMRLADRRFGHLGVPSD